MPVPFAEALEPLVPTVVHLLGDSARLNEWEGRHTLIHLVRVLPLLNREARDLWRKEFDVVALLTLCNYLFPPLNTNHRSRYLDGVLPDSANDPHNWTEPLEPELNPAPQHMLALESIIANRTANAKRMVAEGDAEPQRIAATLRFELSIVQEHAAFRQHPTYGRYFGTCQRVGCSRPALLAPPEAAAELEADEVPSEAEYWKCCRDGRAPPPQGDMPSDMCFCSHGCYKATNAEFKRIVKFDIATPLCATRRGAGPTPERLFRAAVKRNIGIARQLKAMPQVQTSHYPSSMANREQRLREQTTMLSVDLGVLYAAHLVHELPERCRPNRPLPRTEDWRKHGACYLNAVTRVRAVYMKYGRGELARGGTELWLKRLRDRLLTIF
jgi:hypothetical protein